MKDKLNFKTRLSIAGIFTIIAWALIAWDYFHGGVPKHYLLHDDNMPGISNWWGALIIPILTFICLYRIDQRLSISEGDSKRIVLTRFILAFLFSTVISITFSLGSDAPTYLMLLTFVIAFFFPFYKSEFLLGYVMGSLYTFGAFIPTAAGLILIGVFFCLFQIGKMVSGFLKTKKVSS